MDLSDQISTITYGNGILDFDVDKVIIRTEADMVYQGSFQIRVHTQTQVHGYICASDIRLQISHDMFDGKSLTVPFLYDTTGMCEQDTISGEIHVITNVGEFGLPYEVIIEDRVLKGELGEIRNLFHFANLARVNWEQAIEVFANPLFERVLVGSGRQYIEDYRILLKYGMEESGKGNYQYFTGDENGYLNGIMSYLSLAHKFGLNGVIPNGTYDFSAVIQRLQNLKPKTLKEQWDENISNYKTSVGNGKIIKGAYTHNGLYLDASLSAPSIVEENQKLREKYANGLYNDDITPSTENIMTPEKLAEFEKKKMYLSFKAVQEETKMMVEAERKKSQQKDVIFRRTLEEAKAKTEKELNKEEKDDRDTIVLNVLAKLKDGLSSKQINQIYQEVNKILTDNGFEADSYITQT